MLSYPSLIDFITPTGDTITLKGGLKFIGKVTKIAPRSFTIKNCDTTGFSVIKFSKKNIIKITTHYVPFFKHGDITPIPLVDTTKCFHIGIIPYLFLTRSSGIYLRYDLKKFALEYRPSYTYATNLEPQTMLPLLKYDNFYFQGINNSFIFYFPMIRKTQIGLVLSYKHWWHGKESIINDNSEISSKEEVVFFKEIRSTVMNGFGAGIEFTNYLTVYKNFDLNFFWGASFTYFNSYSNVYSMSYSNRFSGSYIPSTYPYNETKSRLCFNLTFGFKVGFKKPLKK